MWQCAIVSESLGTDKMSLHSWSIVRGSPPASLENHTQEAAGGLSLKLTKRQEQQLILTQWACQHGSGFLRSQWPRVTHSPEMENSMNQQCVCSKQWIFLNGPLRPIQSVNQPLVQGAHTVHVICLSVTRQPPLCSCQLLQFHSACFWVSLNYSVTAPKGRLWSWQFHYAVL